jgi:hypothetical protein
MASTKPRISPSTRAISHCGSHHPARAAMACTSASMAAPNRSAGGKGGMLFTLRSYDKWQRLGKREITCFGKN